MYRIEVHEGINRITSLFYYLGLWHRGDEPTVREARLKFFYFIYYMLFPISLMSGVISNDNKDESIFLVAANIIILVMLLNFFYIIWKKEQILELFNNICVYSIEDRAEFILVNDKLKRFMRFVKVLLGACFFDAICAVTIVPFLGTERKFFLAIGFPLDWKNNEIAFWIAFTFFSSQTFLSTIAVLFSVILWYIMLNCAVKYEILGNQIRNIGIIKPTDEKMDASGNKRKTTDVEKHNIYLRDLIEAIKSHNHLRDLICQSESFFAIILFITLGTSGICICGSIYSLVFSIGNSLIETMMYDVVMFYNIFEIFMVMYFGNEIKSSSDRLSYSLFESNWTGMPEPIKKYVIIFGEMLKQPQVLVICKLYPLTLETFTRILKSAYSMFNILQNLNHK